jgi:hypothetical protein
MAFTARIAKLLWFVDTHAPKLPIQSAVRYLYRVDLFCSVFFFFFIALAFRL